MKTWASVSRSVLGRYLCKILREMITSAVTLVGIVGFFLSWLIRPDILLPRYVFGAIALLSYAYANVRLFAALDIAADIHLSKSSSDPPSLTYPHAAQTKDPSGHHPYFDWRNLPRVVRISLTLEATNSGRGDGELVCELDVERTQLPPFFTFAYDAHRNTYRYHYCPHQICGGVQRQEVHYDFVLVITELESMEFAKTLKSLYRNNCTYTIALRYYTRHAQGTAGQRLIELKGSLDPFCQTLVYDWEQYNHNDLVRIYNLASPSTAVESQ